MIRLKELRKENSITIKTLSDIIGMSESTISLYENGKRQPDYKTLIKFADFFGVTTDYLLCRTDDNAIYINNTEKKIVTAFRKLTPEDQNYIVKTIDIVSAQYPSEENTYDIAAFKSHKHINIEDEE